jgi:hypothetical protein
MGMKIAMKARGITLRGRALTKYLAKRNAVAPATPVKRKVPKKLRSI